MFCTQITKMSDYRADMQDKMSRDFVTIRPIFTKIVLKDAQDSKELKTVSERRGAIRMRSQTINKIGGRGRPY